MNITIIAAVAANRAIGYDNKLLYRLPDDMRRFRLLTTGHTVIMGRNTFNSLPKGALPNRRNIVLSTTLGSLPRCECYASLDEALAHCGLDDCLSHGALDDDVFIIGGARVYADAMPLTHRLCLTEVADTPAQADVFFPDYSSGWRQVARENHPRDDRHAFPFAFVDYVREQ